MECATDVLLDLRPQARSGPTTSTDNTRPSKRCRSPKIPGRSTVAKQLEGKKPSRRPPLSCGECRRLKLKCDRVFPCQSCVKRGCSGICPDGALTAGAGSRYILANTEQLHDKITKMGERIRNLEEALESVQAKSSSSMHPLLQPELLLVKNSLELYGSDTPAVRPPTTLDEEVKGGTITSDRLYVDQPEYPLPDTMGYSRNSDSDVGLPSEITQLSWSFPVPWATSQIVTTSMRQRIRDMLPSRADAEYLCEQARANAMWQYNLNPDEAFLPKLVHEVYSSPLSNLSPRRLALLLMFLAMGCLVDLQRPAESPDGERYHQLSRAALCEFSIVDETDISAVQTMFMMTWYLMVSTTGKRAIASAWSIMGLNAKLAQSIGLHRESTKWQAMPDRMLERRALYWEMMNLDARLSLSLGRPPSICAQHTSCEQPSYKAKHTGHTLNVDAHYHGWKHGFHAECLGPVLELAVSTKKPEYLAVLKLDSVIRDFPVPPVLRTLEILGGSPSRSLTMQQALVFLVRESAILQLHRPFHNEALSEAESGVEAYHRFAPSVLATYHSSINVIACLNGVYALEPDLSARFAIFWCNTFSAAVTLCLLVSKAPACLLSEPAVQELGKVVTIFEVASARCPKAAENLSLLRDVIERVQHAYSRWKCGHTAPNSAADPADERLRQLGIQTPFEDHSDTTNSPASSTSHDPWENVHPTLLQLFNSCKHVKVQSIHSASNSASPATPCQRGDMSDHLPWLDQDGHTESMDGQPWYQSNEFGFSLPDAEVDEGYPYRDLDGTATRMLLDTYANTQFTFDFGPAGTTTGDHSDGWMTWFKF